MASLPADEWIKSLLVKPPKALMLYGRGLALATVRLVIYIKELHSIILEKGCRELICQHFCSFIPEGLWPCILHYRLHQISLHRGSSFQRCAEKVANQKSQKCLLRVAARSLGEARLRLRPGCKCCMLASLC